MKIIKIILILFAIFSAKNSFSQIVDSIHYDWKVLEYSEEIDENAEPIKRCYVISKPKESATNYTGDREVYLAVTRFEEDRIEEVSTSSGFQYKINGKVNAVVGDKFFILFTRDNIAWNTSKINDKNFIEEMLRSDFIKIRGDSSIASYAVDTYSLKGFARAYKRMKQLCS
jgi:hypothetical protein